MRSFVIAAAFAVLLAGSLTGQSVLERSPNIHGVWGLENGAAFILSHRFELVNGGDEVISFPTLSLAAALPLGLTAGLDYTSYSEAIPSAITDNEVQLWLKRPFRLASSVDMAVMGGYNTAAESADGALDLRLGLGRFQLFGEARGFSSMFGTDDAGAAGAVGAGLRITQYLGITGDVGRVLTTDTIPTAWSAAVAIEIPASPHTLSLQVTNTGAHTLQGASRKKVIGQEPVRFGFAFTVPFGGSARWARIFNPVSVVEPPAAADSVAAVVQIRQLAYSPARVTIRQGQTVEWVNLDPTVHTVTETDRAWDSGLIEEGGRFRRSFDEPGTYTYFCLPHPTMQGTIVVTP